MDPCFLFRSKCIEFATHSVQSAQDMICLSASCSFEEGMLEKVRKAVFVLQFVAAAGTDHDAAMRDLSCQVLMYNTYSVFPS